MFVKGLSKRVRKHGLSETEVKALAQVAENNYRYPDEMRDAEELAHDILADFKKAHRDHLRSLRSASRVARRYVTAGLWKSQTAIINGANLGSPSLSDLPVFLQFRVVTGKDSLSGGHRKLHLLRFGKDINTALKGYKLTGPSTGKLGDPYGTSINVVGGKLGFGAFTGVELNTTVHDLIDDLKSRGWKVEVQS